VIAALLGADEMGFATAPLIASGCVMMRACHLNTCPVGIATQDPELRKKFAGKPEHVVNFFFFVAEEARRIMAQLGIATFDELVGRSDLLEVDDAVAHWRSRGVDLSAVLHVPEVESPLRRTEGHTPVLYDALDWELIEAAEFGGGVFEIRNRNRTVGGLLSSWVTRRWGAGGAPERLRYVLHGSAGQSFGAWLVPGIELTLVGDANDYVGKGLSGGTLALRPPDDAGFLAERNVIAGNTILYGATAGKAFFRGLVGERFAVRNSGATAVVEGVGDHGCEYMTGGIVVVLGPTGRNFAAGMSGGIAYVLELDESKCNRELVALEELDDGDLELVRALVEEHRLRTGSTVDVDFARFVKVMPHDYKAALQTASAGGHGLFITETEEVAA
jgi:glutamate synthase domain-containing protein 3